MSIVGIMSSMQSIGMRYNSTGSEYSALDSKRALASNTEGANQDLLFARDKDLDSQLIQDRLSYKVADARESSEKKQIDDWAKSFNVFA